MKKIKMPIFLVVISLFFISPLFCKEARKDLSNAVVAKLITGTLDHEVKVVNFIPGLKKEKDEAGKNFYTLQGVRLENLNRKELDALFNKIQNEATRIRTERLNAQLESIRQAEQANRAAQQASRISTVTAPPPQPPKAPPIPPAAQQIPKAPPPPPTPPRR